MKISFGTALFAVIGWGNIKDKIWCERPSLDKTERQDLAEFIEEGTWVERVGAPINNHPPGNEFVQRTHSDCL